MGEWYIDSALLKSQAKEYFMRLFRQLEFVRVLLPTNGVSYNTLDHEDINCPYTSIISLRNYAGYSFHTCSQGTRAGRLLPIVLPKVLAHYME